MASYGREGPDVRCKGGTYKGKPWLVSPLKLGQPSFRLRRKVVAPSPSVYLPTRLRRGCYPPSQLYGWAFPNTGSELGIPELVLLGVLTVTVTHNIPILRVYWIVELIDNILLGPRGPSVSLWLESVCFPPCEGYPSFRFASHDEVKLPNWLDTLRSNFRTSLSSLRLHSLFSKPAHPMRSKSSSSSRLLVGVCDTTSTKAFRETWTLTAPLSFCPISPCNIIFPRFDFHSWKGNTLNH